MKNTRIVKEVAINATKEKVWSVISDFGSIEKTSPGVTKSYLTTDQSKGVGTERHCDFTFMGASVEEKVIEWNEGDSIKIDIYERKNLPLVKDMIAEFILREDNGKTILRGVLDYSMSGGLGSLMNSVMMKKMNSKNWDKVLAGFKKFSESGELVDQNTKLDLEAVFEVND